jgi:glycosyltransferase involved in cell wall biosynthesis
VRPRLSIVVPAYNEGESIVPFLDRVFEAVALPCEMLVVFDTPEDTTRPFLEKYAREEPRLVPTLNTYGRGPAKAIRFGIDHASADVVVAAASRYTRPGRQIGGPAFKSFLSRMAGLSLYWFARVGTRDATNSFKAYSREFVQHVGVESDAGFEIGIELVAKARRHRLPVAEVPTIWLDRAFGASNFQLKAWIPRYLRWYRYAFGPSLAEPTK